MVSLLTGLVKTYLEKLIDGAIAETRYVCCFTSIAEEFKEEQAKLKTERRTVDQRVEERQKKVDQLLREDTKTKKTCFFGFCPDCIWRYKRGKELADKIVNIKQLVVEEEKFENIEIPRPLPDVEFHSSQNYIHFKGRELEYKELLKALKDENNFTTGLYGMGGSGKTTLTKEVGKELKQSKIFSHVIDVTVSYTPNIKKIQDDIAGPLGLKLEDCNESDRPKMLWSRLTNGEKILVILDDVWDQKPPLDFDDIGIPKQDNHKGCRVLVTTRNKRVLNKMGCDEIIKLEVLSKKDSRIMFENYAGITNNSLKSLIDKGRKIADACKRLPVAIAVVASSLKGQESIEEWDLALKSLQNPLSSIQGVDESLVEIYNCLKFSYDYLKDEKVKRLFLLCSVFPEDKEIDVEILTRLCIGTGLFGEDNGSYNDGRNQVVVAKNKLLDSCLLLEAGKGCVKMHDLIREVAQWIANKEIRIVNMSPKDPKSLIDRDNNTKYLFWEGKAREMFSSGFGGSNLEILIVALDADGDGDCAEAPNSFFENIAGLRVFHLDYEGSYYTPLAFSLPRSIQSWMNIRSLLVSRVDLGDISVLGKLQHLETLELDSCKITELPHEITKLEKFKLLKLRRCQIRRKNLFEVIEKCLCLEELYFQHSFNEFCKEINFFPKMQRYAINTQEDDVKLAVEYVSLSKVMHFLGRYDKDVFSEATWKYFIQTTQYLVLGSISWQWRNIIPEIVPIDQGMNDVIYLDLRNSSYLQYLIKVVGSQVPNVFSKLVVLKLGWMEKLEELCNGPLSSDSLKALKELSISTCWNLKSLFKFNLDLCNLKRISLSECRQLVSVFQLSTAKSLIMLEKLEIDDCGKLESIIADEKSGEESKEEILVDDGDNEDKKHSSMFSNLKVLNIKKCPQLEVVLPFLSGDLLIPLETISIESCEKLKYIFDQFVELGSLKNIMLNGLLNFIGIFPESMALFAKGSSSTLREDFKEPTQLDPIKCSVFSWTQKCCYGLKYKHKLRSATTTKIPLLSKDQLQHCPVYSCFSRQPQILCNITTIELGSVSKIKSVFTLSTARRMLQLETLTIWSCHELKHIIVDIGDDNGGNNSSNVFPRLKELNVSGCEQLEYIFGHYVDDHQSHNEIHLHLPELKTVDLWNLQSLVAMCPKQYHTTFPSLMKFELGECSLLASKSIGDFISHASSTSLDNTTIKCFSGQPLILCNITTIKLSRVSNIKSVFTLSTARRMLHLETLTIERCFKLKHIIINTGDDNGGNNSSNVFPRLKELKVYHCKQLEYIFGHYTNVHESLNEIHLHLSELKSLKLENLPNLVAMCPKKYHTTFPPLVNLELRYCSQVASKSIGDFISHGGSTSLDNTTIKELSGNVEHFLALETLVVSTHFFEKNPEIENVFILDETNGQQLNLMLNYILLVGQHVMKYLFVGPKSSVTLHNLTEIYIERCEKLETLFSTCVVRCFPQLRLLSIKECNDLKHIIEEDAEDEMMSNSLPTATGTCFPKLETLEVENCNKLEFVFPVSIYAQKVDIPNLKKLYFVNLPSLSQTQANQFQNVNYRVVANCGLYKYIYNRGAQLLEDSNSKVTGDLATGIEVQATWGHELSSSQCLEEIQVESAAETRSKPPTESLSPKSKQESFKTSVEEGTMLVHANVITSSTHLESVGSSSGSLVASSSGSLVASEHKTSSNCMEEIQVASASETRSKPPTQSLSPKSKQESFKTSVEEGTMLVNAKTITSSTHSESGSLVTSEHKTSSNEAGYGKISITSQTNDQRVKDRNLTAETSKDFSVGVKVQAASGHKLTSSQEFLNEPSTSQQHPVGEADTTAKPYQGNNCLEETKDESIQEVLISEKATTTVMGSFKRSDEQGSTLDNVKTVTTSTPIESVKEDEIRVSEPKPSPTTNSSLASESISTPYEGNPPQTVENPSSSSLITKELQQLVSKKHLASENLSLLTDFLVKHPFVCLMDNSLSNRYKGYAYNCLAELLKFLQTHSVLNLLESSRSEFVELLQDARRFSFDRGWLDGVERRALYPDLQVSQHVSEKMLNFKQQVSQHVEDLKHHLTSSEAVLESINQHEAQVLESRAALSAPLGY